MNINWKEELEKGVESFDRFWMRNLDAVPSLSGENLRAIDFKGFDLKGADLSSCDLSRAGLMHANLRYANLKGASLFNTDLGNANLYGASISFHGNTMIVGYLTPDGWGAVQKFRGVRE